MYYNLLTTGQCVNHYLTPIFNGSTKFWLYDRRVSSANRLYSRDGREVAATSSWHAYWPTVLSDTRETTDKCDNKFLATVCDKQRYHNLQQYSCTHHDFRRKLQSAQFPWLRDYIELNTKFKTLVKNDFEKNLYKLMNNAIFDKPWRTYAIASTCTSSKCEGR